MKFQGVSGCFRVFQGVSGCFRLFQVVSGAHMNSPGHTDVVSGRFQESRMKFQGVSGGFRLFQVHI